MSFDANNTYCSTEQLRRRLTTYGIAFIGDVDTLDAYQDTTEAVYEEEAIEYANVLADEALCGLTTISQRVSNSWIKDRVVDIAAGRFFSLAGREVPATLQKAYDDAMDRLAAVREGELTVPGLVLSSSFTRTKRSKPIGAIGPC